MTSVRKPIQKRSIEKKNRILANGFELFCEKGYFGTNTNEISQLSNVSTGVIYSYFSDKRDIFIESFEMFFEKQFTPLTQLFNEQADSFDFEQFIHHTLTVFIEMYRDSSQAILELSYMMSKDEEIFERFSAISDKMMTSFIDGLHEEKIDLTLEQMYLIYAIIDSVAQEISHKSFETIDHAALKKLSLDIMGQIADVPSK